MAFRDLLLAALTYPDATPDRALRSGVALAKRLGGELTVGTMLVDIPELHNVLANALLDLDRLARREEAQATLVARQEANTVALAAEQAGVKAGVTRLVARLYEEADAVAAAARTRDLCLAPIGRAVLADTSLAQAVLFGSGRPLLVYPEEMEVTPQASFRAVAIAWDGSAKAARAVADAMPVLKEAEGVRILLVTGEKSQVVTGLEADLTRHLRFHGVMAMVDEADAGGRPIGEVLSDYLVSQRIDLLVMGGFGHSRLQEFVLGGATASILAAPPCPVFMSH